MYPQCIESNVQSGSRGVGGRIWQILTLLSKKWMRGRGYNSFYSAGSMRWRSIEVAQLLLCNRALYNLQPAAFRPPTCLCVWSVCRHWGCGRGAQGAAIIAPGWRISPDSPLARSGTLLCAFQVTRWFWGGIDQKYSRRPIKTFIQNGQLLHSTMFISLRQAYSIALAVHKKFSTEAASVALLLGKAFAETGEEKYAGKWWGLGTNIDCLLQDLMDLGYSVSFTVWSSILRTLAYSRYSQILLCGRMTCLGRIWYRGRNPKLS